MKVTVLFFGPYADAMHDSSVTLDMPQQDTCTAGQVKAQLAERHPKLRGMLKSALIAVNHQAVPPDQPVHENDELAVIGLVSGG
ncbi:MAG: MoaD/ThiS family protein [Phycisphaeraceae bacterium]|nr:MoaD/ThiS family protein [Phycisphaeraceae bacterium]